MATYLEEQAFCPNCDERTLVRARSINHVLHLLVSFLLCGWWLYVWGFMALLWTPRWLCSRCGETCDGPRPVVAKVIGIVCLAVPTAAIAAIILLCGIGGLIGSKPQPAPSQSVDPASAELGPMETAAARPKVDPDPKKTPPKAIADPTPEPEKPAPTAPIPEPIKPVEPPAPVKPKSKWVTNATAKGTTTIPFVMAKQATYLDQYRDLLGTNPTKARKMIDDDVVVLIAETLAVHVESRARGYVYFRPTEGSHEGELWVARDKDVVDDKK